MNLIKYFKGFVVIFYRKIIYFFYGKIAASCITLFLLLVLKNYKAYCQDPQFSQFYGVATYLNPALTGSTLQGRITLDNRVQWPAFAGSYNTFCLSYDQNFSEINSGFGLLLVKDKAGNGNLRFTSVGGLYSYDIRASRNTGIRLGINLSYVEKTIDYQALTFTDQLLRGGNVPTTESFANPKKSYLDNHIGLMVYGHNYWGGISIKHLNIPNESLLDGTSVIPVNITMQGGYNITLKKNLKKKESQKLTIAALYKAQKEYDQFDIGIYYTKFPLVIGGWYRGLPIIKSYQPGYGNNDALAILLGLDFRTFRLGYSYDITTSKLVASTSGAHEIALVYEFASHEKKKKSMSRRFVVPCAKF